MKAKKCYIYAGKTRYGCLSLRCSPEEQFEERKTLEMFHLKPIIKTSLDIGSFFYILVKSTFPITGLSLHQRGNYGIHKSKRSLGLVRYLQQSANGLNTYHFVYNISTKIK